MSKVKKEYISDRFCDLYARKWQSQGKTQKEFTEAIKAVDPSSGITASYVSKLLSGTYSPKRYLSAICQVLDVDISEFTPKKRNDRYKYVSEYADGVEKALEDKAIKDFKIDLTFFQGLRNIIPDFDKLFPMFLPIFEYGAFDTNHKPYQRYVPAESAETSQGKGLLQIERDGKTYFLSVYDLKIIKIVQELLKKKAVSYFELLLKQYAVAEDTVNRRYQELVLQENPNYETDQVLWTVCHLSEETIQTIDKYGMYTDEELSRFNLERGKPVYREPGNTEGE